MIAVRTLGPLDVALNGGPAPRELTWSKTVALAVYLARSPRRTRARDHLVGLLWPDKPDAAARHSLDVEVARLRKYVGREMLTSEGDRIRLGQEAVTLDVDEFVALVARGDWSGAAALVEGEFLQGFKLPDASAFEDWLAAERIEWRHRAVGALTAAADSALAAGDAAAAAALARRAVGLDSTSDRALQSMMQALALSGDRGAALDAFSDFEVRLRSQGLAIGAETSALAARIRRERDWRLVQGAREPVMQRRAPLLGREAELAALVAGWDEIRGGSAGVLMVTGDAGTGRTRLADELALRVRLGGGFTVVVRGVPADREVPWSGWRGLAAQGLATAPGVPAAAREVLAAFALEVEEWRDRFGPVVLGAEPVPPGRALSEILRAVASEMPVLVVLDDAHWLDAATLLALDAALRDLSRLPVGVLVTLTGEPLRPELEMLRARIGRELRGRSERIGPLSPPAMMALAGWAFPGLPEEDRARTARRVMADSAGLPLLAVELLHAIALGLDPRDGESRWLDTGRTLDQTLPGELPDVLIGAIRVGFGNRSPGARQLLEALAVLPERQTGEMLGRAAELRGDALEMALDELEYHRWVTVDARGYAYVARMVRLVVERDMVTEGKRRRILARSGSGG